MFFIDTVHRMARTERLALVGTQGDLSYAQLDRDSDALAAYLRQELTAPGPVALWGDKEAGLLVGITAAFKAGRPFVMLPSYYPAQRVEGIAADAKPAVLISACDIPAPQGLCPVLEKDAVAGLLARYAGRRVEPYAWRDEEAMIYYYTSGSTGAPKGVVTTWGNIRCMEPWWTSLIDCGEPPRLLDVSSYAFCASMSQLICGLGRLGGTLYTVDKKLSQDYQRLLDFILRVDPHTFDCTPSFADICLTDPRFRAEGLPGLKVLTVGGEPLSHGTAGRLLDAFPHTDIVNGYGMTENTMGNVACSVTRAMVEADEPMPIGYVSQGALALIVDEQGQPLPDGQTGELWLVSGMAAPGYTNNAELSRTRFFVHSDGRRGYKTGDLAYRREGLIYYVGRKDHLVKVGGYRVELEEVERYLSMAREVDRCAAVPVLQDQRVVMIAAYVTLKGGYARGMATVSSIKKQMGQYVQRYMIPQKLVFMDELPKNANGKIDRKLLREMASL